MYVLLIIDVTCGVVIHYLSAYMFNFILA